MRFLGFSVCRFTPQFVHLQKMISQRVILGLERERESEREGGEREQGIHSADFSDKETRVAIMHCHYLLIITYACSLYSRMSFLLTFSA